MFYPCVYFYAMWDAYRDAGGVRNPFAFFPFVFAAYFVTVGLMYSSKVMLFGKLLGPVWLPMLFTITRGNHWFFIIKNRNENG